MDDSWFCCLKNKIFRRQITLEETDECDKYKKSSESAQFSDNRDLGNQENREE